MFQIIDLSPHSICVRFQGIKVPIDSDIHALSTLEDVHYATEHGVYVINKEVWRKIFGFIEIFIYLLF
jgi:hypothetical protein